MRQIAGGSQSGLRKFLQQVAIISHITTWKYKTWVQHPYIHIYLTRGGSEKRDRETMNVVYKGYVVYKSLNKAAIFQTGFPVFRIVLEWLLFSREGFQVLLEFEVVVAKQNYCYLLFGFILERLLFSRERFQLSSSG